MGGDFSIFELIDDDDWGAISTLLETNPQLFNAENSSGQSVFWLAAAKGEISVIQNALHRPDVDFFKCDKRLRDPLAAAQAFKQTEVIKLLEQKYHATKSSDRETNTRNEGRRIEEVKKLFSDILYGIHEYRTAILSILLLTFFVGSATGYLYKFKQPPRRVVAEGSSPEQVEAAVLSIVQRQTDRDNETSNLRRNIGEEVGEVRVELTAEYLKDTSEELLTCKITVGGERSDNSAYITVLRSANKEVQVVSTAHLLKVPELSTRDAIASYAVEYCFE